MTDITRPTVADLVAYLTAEVYEHLPLVEDPEGWAEIPAKVAGVEGRGGVMTDLSSLRSYSAATVWLAPRDSAGGLIHGERIPTPGQFVCLSTRSPGFAVVLVGDSVRLSVPVENIEVPS